MPRRRQKLIACLTFSAKFVSDFLQRKAEAHVTPQLRVELTGQSPISEALQAHDSRI
jgi:hypothetical protein